MQSKNSIINLVFVLLLSLLSCKQGSEIEQNLNKNDVVITNHSSEPIDSTKTILLNKLTTNKEDTQSIISSYKIDLNLDGKPDKINVYSNNNHEDNYDAQHFGLPIKLMKQTDSGFEEMEQNNNLVFENPNAAMIDGFESIYIEDKYFTIVQQTHSDYNILISSKTTFKVNENEILLHKYQEEYFDKANHEREILPKSWRKADFGKINFESVTGDFLNKLRLEK